MVEVEEEGPTGVPTLLYEHVRKETDTEEEIKFKTTMLKNKRKGEGYRVKRHELTV